MSASDPRLAPWDLLVANDFAVRKFSGGVFGTETTHSANVVPDEFKGKYLTALAVGGNCHFGFSTNSSAEVDRAVAATAAGASLKVGGVLPVNVKEDIWCPDSPAGTPMYFVRESDAVGTIVYLSLSDRRQ